MFYFLCIYLCFHYRKQIYEQVTDIAIFLEFQCVKLTNISQCRKKYLYTSNQKGMRIVCILMITIYFNDLTSFG